MILVFGFGEFRSEIEVVLMLHSYIFEAAAIAVPFLPSGEAVKIFIVKNNGRLTKELVDSYCREQLTACKCLREIVFTDELSKSNVGKFLRNNLR